MEPDQLANPGIDGRIILKRDLFGVEWEGGGHGLD